MAIYYIDPHLSTTTSTAGTWADPWTFSQTTKTGLTNGDEIRIKGVALTSLLTATTYTVSYTNNYQLTVTAGGGLGADFPAGSLIYFPDSDAFAKVSLTSGNVLFLGHNAGTHIPRPNTTSTSFTIRKVNTTTYPASGTGTVLYFMTSGSAFNNITVSDCWTSSSTRVTDGTVKTIIHTSATSAASLWVDTNSSATLCSGLTYNCHNTHIIYPNSASAQTVYVRASSSTYNFNQIYSASSSVASSFAFGAGGIPISNFTANIKHYSGYSLIGSTGYGMNVTLNVDNYYGSNSEYIFGIAGQFATSFDPLTVTLGNVVVFNNTTAMIFAVAANNLTVNLNGDFDNYGGAKSSFLFQGYGLATINTGSSFSYYSARRTVTTPPTLVNVSYFTGNVYGSRCFVPSMSLPSGWAMPTDKWSIQLTAPVATAGASVETYKVADAFTVSLPDTSINSWYPYTFCDSHRNVLVVFRDGSAPKEICGIGGNKQRANGIAISFPQVTTDASVYRTTGPSLKAYLANYNAAYWVSTSTSIKNIRIPVTGGTAYTVSGYIRTDDSAFVNGDCKMWVVQNGASLDDQSMTTSCINAWEQFTLTFTAPQTGEVQLAWEMRFANGDKSMWLNDLTVV